jgi:ABC-type nitrate/sulfonate/bicarbonate transport system ATPase subunit
MRVTIDNLGYGYVGASGDTTVALSGFDLDVQSGSFHSIVGPNGCGKSTLLRLIAGLDEPGTGSIEFVGERRFRHPAAMVFQTPRLLPWWTVERNVGTGLEFGERPIGLQERVRDFYTSLVGLGGLGKRLPGELSGGERSRAGLGRALAHEADVLLLDEPFAHLDAISRQHILEELERLWEADGRTTIMVTHDIQEAVFMSDRVSVMQKRPGRVVATIEVDAPRPRYDASVADPGIRSAVVRVRDALEGR